MGGETIVVSGWRTRCGGKDSAPRSQISREISGILPSAGLANFQLHFRKSIQYLGQHADCAGPSPQRQAASTGGLQAQLLPW